MTDQLEAAVRAHRRAQAKAEASRIDLANAIAAAARANVPQRDIVRITGYTRERIRQIVRAAEADLSTAPE